MDETLDLDYSCSSDEIITKSPTCDTSQSQMNKEIFKAQQMLDNLKLTYMKASQQYKVVHKSSSHIIRENLKLKRRIEQLEKKLDSSLRNAPANLPDTKRLDHSLSLSTILNSSSLIETASSQRFCCCNHANSPSSSKLKSLCSFYQFRGKLGTKRSRPPSWYVEKPKKRFLNEVVLSQLPLFKF